MMAIAASRTPEREVPSGPFGPPDPLTYLDVVQGCVDFFGDTQNPDGGWRYNPTQLESDQSNTGYATLGLLYAEDFGCTIPATIKPGLNTWINTIQDPVDGDADDGGSWYTPTWAWVNLLKTGNLLTQMSFVGDTPDTPRVQDAIDYIERHWNDLGECGTGWNPPLHAQAAYCIMKGFETMGIELIDLDDDDVPEHDWFDEMSDVIIAAQDPVDGGWPQDCWADRTFATEWALLTIERIAPPPPVIEVSLDIHPTSCPNPLNTKGKGVMPVAILGTEDFDVSQIDPSSIRLINANLAEPVEVSPLRWAMEDVATSYVPNGEEACYACTEEGPDGFMDLTLKFSMQEIVAAIGEVSDGDCLILTLTGNLMEEAGGTAIIGEDVVKIIKKLKDS
jgi:hypothetical protein